MQYTKQLSSLGRYEVAVLGGGPSGVCAAIAAARAGVRTILVEKTGMLGGMATSGLVGPFMTSYDRDGEFPVVRGLFEKIIRRTADLGGALMPADVPGTSRFSSWITPCHSHTAPFDSNMLQCVLDDMVQEAGAEILLYSQFVDSVVKDGRIMAAVLATPGGLCSLEADVFVDCTGNADVAAASGVPTWLGDEVTGVPQPATLFYEVDQVEDERYTRYLTHKAYRMPYPGCYKINDKHVYSVDATDVRSMTAAHIKARQQALESWTDMRVTMPGFEQARITQLASVLGMRESRHIKGKYMLRADDIANNTWFPDAVMTFGYAMDVHSRDGSGEDGFCGDSARWYTIPYRCMVPEGCDNLLIAGKTICAETQAAGSFRVMPGCMALGEAAGTAAALACLEHCKPENAPVEKLQRILLQNGVIILGHEGKMM